MQIREAINRSGFQVTEVVSGRAPGVDRAGEDYALYLGIPVKLYPANWSKHGKSAGYKRNEKMAEYADALIAIWDGKSKGTQHMINIMRGLGKPIYVHKVI